MWLRITLESGFTRCVKFIKRNVIKDGLITKCNFQPRDIARLGFRQSSTYGCYCCEFFIIESRNGRCDFDKEIFIYIIVVNVVIFCK